MRRAIELLPPELKPFFEQFKDEIVLRVTDPDLWRNVGWEEDPNHFLDFGVDEYGTYPFEACRANTARRSRSSARRPCRENGLLPWREAEQFGNLRRAFEEFTRDAPYTTSNVVLFSAVASHYIQDAHQPFHASINYDGALTGNGGIHSRFERDLIERFESRVKLTPAGPVAHCRRARRRHSTRCSRAISSSIRSCRPTGESIAGKDTYDDEYFERFFLKVQPILERRLSEAITATASMIIGAWDQAGRPTVRLRDARPPQKVRATTAMTRRRHELIHPIH